jgi:hydroxyacylglutathione hydrolase
MNQNEDNHKAFLVGFILILLVVLWVLFKPALGLWKGTKSQNEEDKMAEVFSRALIISAGDLHQELNQNSDRFIIDVRNAAEFKKGHIAASRNMDQNSLTLDAILKLGAKKTSEIILADSAENIYKTASKVNDLTGSGFQEVKYLKGGIASWVESGYPLVSSGGSNLDSSKVKKISLEQLKSDIDRAPDLVQIIDIRNSSDFSQGHIKDAKNISLEDLESNKTSISSLKKVIVYGGSEESFNAAVALFDLDFLNVYQLDGSFEDWKKSGGNVEQ